MSEVADGNGETSNVPKVSFRDAKSVQKLDCGNSVVRMNSMLKMCEIHDMYIIYQ